MATNDQKENKPDQTGKQPQAQNKQDTGKQLKDFPKEDMLNLEKGAQAMDQFGGHPEHIEGHTISGTGSGPGTGDWGGDFDRPGSPEGSPGKNDYVEHNLPADTEYTSDAYREAEGPLHYQKRHRPENPGEMGDEASGYPGGGAVRTAEDRIPPAPKDENAGWSPEEPMNRPHNPLGGGSENTSRTKQNPPSEESEQNRS